jgi:uncharacterized membrane protein YgdD (TMEM256/DUF423 family)
MLDAPPNMFWAAAGAINAFLAVACGAFGAHALKRRLDGERLVISGSLYALALSGVRKLGAITPLGGLCFLLGWADFAWIAMSAGR